MLSAQGSCQSWRRGKIPPYPSCGYYSRRPHWGFSSHTAIFCEMEKHSEDYYATGQRWRAESIWMMSRIIMLPARNCHLHSHFQKNKSQLESSREDSNGVSQVLKNKLSWFCHSCQLCWEFKNLIVNHQRNELRPPKHAWKYMVVFLKVVPPLYIREMLTTVACIECLTFVFKLSHFG